MVDFTVWTRVESVDPGRYRAIATASPWDGEQRCAPEERSLDCPTPAAALAAARFLAQALRHDIVSRGNRVVEQGSVQPRSASRSGHARGEPKTQARCAETNG